MIDTKEELGKIERAMFGYGGYQDVQFGLSLVFSMPSSGVSNFIMDMDRIKEILKEAKIQTVDQLQNTPVMIAFEGQRMKSFRVLTEVL